MSAAPLLAAPSSVLAAVKGVLFRPAICAYSFRNELQRGEMTYQDILHMAAETGADGVDLTAYWLPDTKDETLFALKRLAYKLSVSIYSVGIRARMAQPTAELREKEVNSVRQWLDAAERLGASHVRIFGGDVPQGASEEQAAGWAVETLKHCAEQASRKGILLGVEDDGGITTTAEQTLRLVKGAASPWVGVNLDVGNFRDDAYRQIELCAPLASNVHIKSRVHQSGREEEADWPRVLATLRKHNYRGYLAIEYELSGDPRTGVPKLIGRLREAIRQA